MTEAGQPRTLQEILDSGEPLSRQRALALVRAAAVTIDALHAHQLVHGALCPSAVQVDGEDRVVRLSQGREVDAGDGSRAARAYWSPQRQAGEPARPSDDLYALGLIASALLTGPPVDAVVPPLPAGLEAVLQAQCAWAPSERFASGAEFARELDRAAAIGDALRPLASGADRSEGLNRRPPVGDGWGEGRSSEPAWAAARRVALAREAHRLVLAELPDRGQRERIRTIARHPMQRSDYPDFPLPGGWVAVLVVVLCSVYLFPLYFMLFPHG